MDFLNVYLDNMESRYKKITLSGSSEIPEGSGLIFYPYISMCVDTPSKEYREFMDKYNLEHEVCPKCGSRAHGSTLVDYVFYQDNPEAYQDNNSCTCSDCGDQHVTHERVSVEAFRNKNNGNQD